MSYDTIILTLLILHIAGAILGVGGATFIEVFLNQALSDGKMDLVERGFMKTTYSVLRVGLILSVLTGIGFLVLYLITPGQSVKLYSPTLWAKNTIIVILVVNSILLHYHVMKLRWGSSLSFVSWWTTALLGVFLTNNFQISPNKPFTYFAIMVGYGLAVIVGAFVLEWIRSLTKSKVLPPPTATPG